MTRVWLRSDVRDVTNPNTGSVWAHGEQRQRTTARRRCTRRRHAGGWHSGLWNRLQDITTSLTGKGWKGEAHRGLVAAGVAAQSVDVEVRRRRARRSSWYGCWGGPPAPDLHGLSRGGAVEVYQGSGRSSAPRQGAIASGNRLPAVADSKQNPSRARTESGDSGCNTLI